jgi:hypothetical protein
MTQNLETLAGGKCPMQFITVHIAQTNNPMDGNVDCDGVGLG